MSRTITEENTLGANDDGRCKGTTKDGRPCRARATESGFCYLHTHPEKAAELGRAGGRANRHVVEGTAASFPPLDNVAGVTAAIAQTIDEVHAKTLHPRIARGLAPLFTALLKGLMPREEEETLKALEEKITRLENLTVGNAT